MYEEYVAQLARKCSRCNDTGMVGGCPTCGKKPRPQLLIHSNLRYTICCPTCRGTGRVYDSVIGRFKPCPDCKRTFIPPKKQEPSYRAPPPGYYEDTDGDGIQNRFDINPFGPG